jgi:hypothetical protein
VADESTQKSSIPVSSILVAAIAIAGVLVAQRAPLESSRPAPQEPGQSITHIDQNVPARLWQDPLATVKRYRDQQRDEILKEATLKRQLGMSQENRHLKRPALVPPDNAYDVNKHLKPSIKRTICGSNQHVDVIAVIILGGTSDEDAEMRRRTRYAIVSALQSAGAQPYRGNTIGYTSIPAAPDSRQRLPKTMPFEWFWKDGKQDVSSADMPGKAALKKNNPSRTWQLVLWLDEEYFYTHALSRLQHLKELLSPPCADETNYRFTVLGPATSDGLEAIKRSIERKQYTRRPDGKPLRMISATATMALPRPNGADEYQNEQYFSVQGVIEFIRLIGPDSRLLDTLHKEIEMHPMVRIPFLSDRKPIVLVISDNDTEYARGFTKYSGGLTEEVDKRKPKVILYLRGLDGRILAPSFSQATQEQPRKNGPNDADKSDANSEKTAHGQHQIDYLRRLQVEIRDQIGKDGQDVVSIWILGSDVYDKLLLLRALKSEFPKATFMTTDLDAGLLQPAEMQWTRNLVVATNYGLTLGNDLQAGVMPFRDGYQTANFLATRIIAAECTDKLFDNYKQATMAWLTTPLLFEIGRTRAVPLRASSGGTLDVGGCFEKVPAAVHPTYKLKPPPDQWWLMAPLLLILSACVVIKMLRLEGPVSRSLLSGAARNAFMTKPVMLSLTLIAVMLMTTITFAAEIQSLVARMSMPFLTGLLPAISTLCGIYFARKTIAHGAPGDRASIRSGCLIIGTVLLGAGLVFPLAATLQPWHQSTEPFEWVEGVSVWPTHLLRFYACLIAVWGIWHIGRMSDRNITAIESTLGCAVIGPPTRIEHIWQRYSGNGGWRVFVTIIIGVVYFVIALGVVAIFQEVPGTPARGADNMANVASLLFFLVFLNITLVCSVVVSISSLVFHVVHKLNALHASAPRTFHDHLAAIRLIAQRSEVLLSIIYYPLLVSALLLVARSPVFDNWDTPNSLLIVLALPFTIAFGCIVWLRYETVNFHEHAILGMKSELARLKGATTAAEIPQLEALLDQALNEKRGAFQSLAYQPMVRALLLPIGGVSGIEIFEHVILPQK